MEKVQLSPQAVGAIMMSVQRGLMEAAKGSEPEKCDITKLLLGLDLELGKDGKLIVLNPPMLEVETE